VSDGPSRRRSAVAPVEDLGEALDHLPEVESCSVVRARATA
jgi:hypothetical protein